MQGLLRSPTQPGPVAFWPELLPLCMNSGCIQFWHLFSGSAGICAQVQLLRSPHEQPNVLHGTRFVFVCTCCTYSAEHWIPNRLFSSGACHSTWGTIESSASGHMECFCAQSSTLGCFFSFEYAIGSCIDEDCNRLLADRCRSFLYQAHGGPLVSGSAAWRDTTF